MAKLKLPVPSLLKKTESFPLLFAMFIYYINKLLSNNIQLYCMFNAAEKIKTNKNFKDA